MGNKSVTSCLTKDSNIKELDAIFKSVDKNKDGKLNLSEFEIFVGQGFQFYTKTSPSVCVGEFFSIPVDHPLRDYKNLSPSLDNKYVSSAECKMDELFGTKERLAASGV